MPRYTTMIDVDPTTATTFFTGLAAGLVLSIRTWWGKKSISQKKAAFHDAIESLGDKKLTVAEVQAYVDKHF